MLWLPALLPERRSEASFADAPVTWKFHIQRHSYIKQNNFWINTCIRGADALYGKGPGFLPWQSLPVCLGFEACAVSSDCALTFSASIGTLVMSQPSLAL